MQKQRKKDIGILFSFFEEKKLQRELAKNYEVSGGF